MKLSTLAAKLQQIVKVMQCPLCGDSFAADQHSMKCRQNHCFDLSAKGYVNLAPAHMQSKEKYDSALFESRRRIFEDGFYVPVLDAVAGMLSNRFGVRSSTLLDVGCGEGYYARGLADLFPEASVIGLDLSRDAITAAARGTSKAHWFVANLKQLPIVSGTVDCVLDVLTPADYTEFKRVLQKDGELIKVIPGSDYLREVRAAVADHLRSDTYDNSQVISHLELHMEVVERVTIHQASPLTPEQASHFLRMTPMTFSISEEALSAHLPSAITIHLEALRCRVR